MRYIIWIVVLFTGNLCAQSTVSITVDKDTIVIGDQLLISYEFDFKDSVDLVDFSDLNEVENLYHQVDTFASEFLPVEILSSNIVNLNQNPLVTIEDIVNQDKKVTVKASVYDIGVITLPQPVMKSGEFYKDFILDETPTIYILPPAGMSKLDSIEINPIKDIIRQEKDWRDYRKYLLGLLLLFALGGILYYLLKKYRDRREEVVIDKIEEPVIIRPADEIALEKLDLLRSKQLWQSGQEKEYHSQLTYILREYLENRYNIPALELSSFEILEVLKDRSLNVTQKQTLRDILNISDVVKFAKGRAGSEINEQFMIDSIHFVKETKDI